VSGKSSYSWKTRRPQEFKKFASDHIVDTGWEPGPFWQPASPGVLYVLYQWHCEDGRTTLNILKTDEMHTLNGWILWYLNYISIKPLNSPSQKKYSPKKTKKKCRKNKSGGKNMKDSGFLENKGIQEQKWSQRRTSLISNCWIHWFTHWINM
jgi:hypothetical protein